MASFHLYEKVDQKRLASMESGAQDLERWLHDVCAQGLAIFENDQSSLEHIARRMVDTKNGGIARTIRSFQRTIREEQDWPERILYKISTLFLFTKAFSKIESLSKSAQDDVLQFAGVNVKKEQLIEKKGIEDEWRILGVQLSYEDRLRKRKTWLKGQKSGKYAMILDYTFGRQRFEYSLRIGESLIGELVFFPSGFPMRVHVKKKKRISKKRYSIKGFTSLAQFNKYLQKGVGKNPWIRQIPCLIDKVKPFYKDRKFYFKDAKDAVLELDMTEEAGWNLMSVSGGQEVQIFGEWNFHQFRPYLCKTENRSFKL